MTYAQCKLDMAIKVRGMRGTILQRAKGGKICVKVFDGYLDKTLYVWPKEILDTQGKR